MSVSEKVCDTLMNLIGGVMKIKNRLISGKFGDIFFGEPGKTIQEILYQDGTTIMPIEVANDIHDYITKEAARLNRSKDEVLSDLVVIALTDYINYSKSIEDIEECEDSQSELDLGPCEDTNFDGIYDDDNDWEDDDEDDDDDWNCDYDDENEDENGEKCCSCCKNCKPDMLNYRF